MQHGTGIELGSGQRTHVLDHLVEVFVDLQCRTRRSLSQGTAMDKADLEMHYLVEVVHKCLGSGIPIPSHLKAHQHSQ